MTLWDSVDETGETSVDTADAPPVATWSVSELGAAIKRALGHAAPGDIWIRGEIRSCRPPNKNGHQYFDLVEPGDAPGQPPKAKIPVTLFQGRRRSVMQTLARSGSDTELADGVEVRIAGTLDWWVGGGKCNFIMSDIDPVFTLGQLDAQRRALLAALAADGLIGKNASVPFPRPALRIGLVTSAGSAAHADFMEGIDASGYAFVVTLADTLVQGVDAPQMIASAIARLAANDVDVIAVVRGGGSRTDLIAFDHTEVAYAIAQCPVPVLTGIGHEIDRSVADEVAHLSLKTPTAVAAELVGRIEREALAIADQIAQLEVRVERRLAHATSSINDRLQRAERAAHVAQTRAFTHLSGYQRQLENTVRRNLRVGTEQLARRADRLAIGASRVTTRASERLENHQLRVRSFDPALTLQRGWSMTRLESGELIRSHKRLTPGTVLITTFADGTVSSTVNSEES